MVRAKVCAGCSDTAAGHMNYLAANLRLISIAGAVCVYYLGISWKLKFYLRDKLECRVFGAVWHLIWGISGGCRLPGAVATDIRADST